MKEAQISNSLKDQISNRRNLEMNSQNDEILKRRLAEIEDVLAAQKILLAQAAVFSLQQLA